MLTRPALIVTITAHPDARRSLLGRPIDTDLVGLAVAVTFTRVPALTAAGHADHQKQS
jgi:hypothetical protein